MSDAVETIADPCARCGYDLRGLVDAVPCLECGLLAGRSRRLDGHLSDATPGWLRGIGAGVAMIFAAHVLAAAWPFAMSLAGDAVARRGGLRKGPVVHVFGFPVNLVYVSLAGFDLAALLLVAGAWLLARPQRRDAGDARLRWSLRACAAVPLATLIAAHVAYERALAIDEYAMAIAASIFLTVGCAPIPALTFVLLRRLALRVLHPGLAEHAAIVGVGLSTTLVAIALIALAMHVGERFQRGWSANSNLATALILAGMVAAILFAGWSALNCIRFTLAFRRAYRGALRTWRDADRAA